MTRPNEQWSEKLYELELHTDDSNDWEVIEDFISDLLASQRKEMTEKHRAEMREAVDLAYSTHNGVEIYSHDELYERYGLQGEKGETK